MQLTNTLTGRLDPLEAAGGEVGIYVCGVTPYDVAHVGHAMSLIVYDVLMRYLRWPGNPRGGLKVTYVSNYTDVDDKLIARGAELERDPIELAHANIEAWEAEQRALGLIDPTCARASPAKSPASSRRSRRSSRTATATPRRTATSTFASARRRTTASSRTATSTICAAARASSPARARSPRSTSRCGRRRSRASRRGTSPGGRAAPAGTSSARRWRSATSATTFDIHGGGVDLIFPHHENEIAQSGGRAAASRSRATGCTTAWCSVDGEKMSKSIGNVVTVADALERWTPDAIRLFVLNSQYRSPNNLTDEAMAAATRAVERLATALADAPEGAGGGVDPAPYRARFVEAMENDLATPQAMASLFDLARAINRARDAGERVAEAQVTLRELAGVLGLQLEVPREAELARLDAVGLSRLAAELDVACGGKNAEETVDALLERRQVARAERDFALGDRIRDGLAALGVAIEDTPAGPRWSVRRD